MRRTAIALLLVLVSACGDAPTAPSRPPVPVAQPTPAPVVEEEPAATPADFAPPNGNTGITGYGPGGKPLPPP